MVLVYILCTYFSPLNTEARSFCLIDSCHEGPFRESLGYRSLETDTKKRTLNMLNIQNKGQHITYK